MKLRYSDYYKIDEERFDELGVFNGYMFYDSKYYLNPKLIKSTTIEQFVGSYQKIQDRFNIILNLINRSEHPIYKTDLYFKPAVDYLCFKENGHIGLGYSSSGKDGRGIGKVLAENIAQTIFKLIKDVAEPEIFEIVGVFQEQVGADRTSDMIIKIIEDDILLYTESIASTLSIPVSPFVQNDKKYMVPYNQETNTPLYLIPTSLLSKLPTWDEMFYDVVYANNDIKKFINDMFGSSYRKLLKEKKHRKELLLSRTDLLQKLIELYRASDAEAYDFILDPSNDFKWIAPLKEVIEANPISLDNSDKVHTSVKAICEQFKALVENTNAYKLFYEDDKKKKRESASQQAFQLFSYSYCQTNNLDISPESNAGRGPVDFKFSRGIEKVLVEVKLSSNDLIHGFETQLSIYEKAEGTFNSFLLVIMVGNDEEKAVKNIEKLFDYKNKISGTKTHMPEIIVVDALLKKSASVA